MGCYVEPLIDPALDGEHRGPKKAAEQEAGTNADRELRELLDLAYEMRDDECAGINYGCNSVQAFDAARAMDRDRSPIIGSDDSRLVEWTCEQCGQKLSSGSNTTTFTMAVNHAADHRQRGISSDPVDECEIGRRIMDPKDGLLLSAVLLYMGGVWKSGRNAQPIADGLRDGIRRAASERKS